MIKPHYQYAVIILNYNVASDAIKAAKSVISSAINENYIICLADNGSTKNNEDLFSLNLAHTKVFMWEKNLGYAQGNNKAMRLLEKEYDYDYVVIMNPDVLIEEQGVIETLISDLERENEMVIGAQPLIHHLDRGGRAEDQCQVRRLHTYFDELIVQSSFLKKIFKKRLNNISYSSQIPYYKPFYFEVPSGCFFVISTKAFKKVNYFDERTFLYQEEFILAHKIKSIGGKFILIPQVKVEHYHGKSTGNRNKGMTPIGHKALVDSVSLYLREYVKSPAVAVWLLAFMMKVEYKLKKVFRYYK